MIILISLFTLKYPVFLLLNGHRILLIELAELPDPGVVLGLLHPPDGPAAAQYYHCHEDAAQATQTSW